MVVLWKHVRAAAIAALLLTPVGGFAQSWLPADRVGERKYKSWDEIPVRPSTTATAAMFHAEPTPASTEGSYRAPTLPSLERRLRPETAELKRYFEDVLASKSDRAVKAAGWRFDLPDAETWFAQQFGPEMGAALTTEYQAVRRTLSSDFLNLVNGLRGRKQMNVSVQLVRGPLDPDANPLQRSALQRMTHPLPLYEVRFNAPGQPGGFSIYSFAYIDGMFRFLGRMQAAAQPAEQPIEPPSATPFPLM